MSVIKRSSNAELLSYIINQTPALKENIDLVKLIADALLGEITPQMAVAIGQSNATKILVPVNKCDNLVAGVINLTTTALIDDTLNKLQEIINQKSF